MTKVSVYHNVATENGRPLGMLDGFTPGNPVVAVAELDLDVADDLAACEKAFFLFNVGDDPEFGTPDPRAVAYRQRRNRSLSVGDVVRVQGRWYACARSGWDKIEEPGVFVHTTHGTTPLSAEPAP